MKTHYDKLTNLNAVIKTLRFELIPCSQSAKNIKNSELILLDEELNKLYEKLIKPLMDQLHNEFIEESLKEVTLDLKILRKIADLMQNKPKDPKSKTSHEKQIQECLKILRVDFNEYYKKTGGRWKDKYANYGIKLNKQSYEILSESGIIQVLSHEHQKHKSDLEKFKGFTGYLSTYNENRKNYYSTEDKFRGGGKKTAVATRAIDDNLIRYIENYANFQSLLNQIDILKDYQDLLKLETYVKFLTQEGINQYNSIIGGYIHDNGNKVQGLNELINLESQRTGVKYKKLKFLFKQIGTKEEKIVKVEITNENIWDILNKVSAYYTKPTPFGNSTIYMFDKLKEIVLSTLNQNEAVNGVFINKEAINTLSNKWFINWQILANTLSLKINKKTNDYATPKYIGLFDIKDALDKIGFDKKNKIEEEAGVLFKFSQLEKLSKSSTFGKRLNQCNNAWEIFKLIWEYEITQLMLAIDDLLRSSQKIENTKFDKKNNEHIQFVKNVCDSYLGFYRMVKYFDSNDSEVEKDANFYEYIDYFIQDFPIVKYYNEIRNFVTRKQYNQNKLKLNFKNPQLLNGWSDGQEQNKGAVLLRNNDNFYLGILLNRQVFRTDKKDSPMYKTDSTQWERLIMKNLAFKTLAGKGFVSEYGIKYSDITNEQEAIEKLKSFINKKYVNEYTDLKKIIDNVYKTKKEFDNDINNTLKEAYSLDFTPINKEVLFQYEKESKLILFKIQNKDLKNSKKTNSNKNIHTIYWKALFSKENFTNVNIALNAGGEVFFRKGQKEKLEKIENKDFYKNNRYAYDKYFLHIPITINDGKKTYKFNRLVNNILKDNEMKILGIDRGEKHLMYYSLIDNKGNIIDQGSFNEINNFDYNEILTNRAKEMKEGRINWQEIGSIKELKSGYLSQVVNKIYELAINSNAIIVLEDLNTQFKSKRLAKIEKSVYTKFELALAKKLNHVVLKNKKDIEIGGALNGYQLTPVITEMQHFEVAKQWGIMFYTRANYTSTTDPVTGWRKHMYISNHATTNDIKNFFNPSNENNIKMFYNYKYNAWGFRYLSKETNIHWDLIAHKNIQRSIYDRKNKTSRTENIFIRFNKLFEQTNKTEDIYDQVIKDTNFDWKELVVLWNLLNQIRNTDYEDLSEQADFIQSPIEPFFDSRNEKTQNILPKNGDANGAYNIARKGVILMERIKNTIDDKIDYLIKDIDWDKWVNINNNISKYIH